MKIVFSRFQYALPLRSKDAPYKHTTSTYPNNHLTHSQQILPHHSSHHKLYAYICVSNSWDIIELCQYSRSHSLNCTEWYSRATNIRYSGNRTEITKLLKCCATYHNASIVYKASDVVLHVYYDESYLSLFKSQNGVFRHYSLNNLSSHITKELTSIPKPNGPIFTLYHILRHIMISAAKT